jgi:hypothetical protein
MRPEADSKLPITEEVTARIAVLPTRTTAGCDDIRFFCLLINGAIRRGGR